MEDKSIPTTDIREYLWVRAYFMAGEAMANRALAEFDKVFHVSEVEDLARYEAEFITQLKNIMKEHSWFMKL